MKQVLTVTIVCLSSLIAPNGFAAPAEDAWVSLQLLEGTWDARSNGGDAAAQVSGSYTFKRELKDHILARSSETGGTCRGPEKFDCDHRDLLYVFQEAQDQPLKAIYFDNEGHVIHYDVSTPGPNSVVFSLPAIRRSPISSGL